MNSDQNPEVITGEYDAMICIGTLAAAHVKPNALVEMIRMIKIGEILNYSFLLKLAGEWDYYHNEGESKNQRSEIRKEKILSARSPKTLSPLEF